jgi:hypothetical protein
MNPVATAGNRCDICQTIVPVGRNDEKGQAPFSLAEHRWDAHGIEGVTACSHCGVPLRTSGLAEHLALEHDLPEPTESQGIDREAVRKERETRRRQDDDDDLRDELREFLRNQRHSPPLGFGGTIAAILCALLLLPAAKAVVAGVSRRLENLGNC